MKQIRVLKNWQGSIDYLSPSNDGTWGDYRFTEEPIEHPDGLVVLNSPKNHTTVTATASSFYTLLLEPPTRLHQYLARGTHPKSRLFAPQGFQVGNAKVERCCPMIPWHVTASFSDLSTLDPFEAKVKSLSTVTSTVSVLPEHKRRVKFLRQLSKKIDFDWFGRGASEIENKLEGLLPYRYALVYENFRGLDYWSEKLADAFLAGCFPIYIGCTNIHDFFPEESLVVIDPEDRTAANQIQGVLASNVAEERRESIIHARSLCLNEYNLLSFLARTFNNEEPTRKTTSEPLTLDPSTETDPFARLEGWVRWRRGKV